ncbi:MAG: hypothetical protein ACRC5H_03840 [Treponemataceae bacterium]
MQKIIFIFIFIFLFIGCASTRNNTGGTLGLGSSHLESIAVAGELSGGIETGNDLTSRIANELEQSQSLSSNLAQSSERLAITIEQAHAITQRISTILQQARERANQENSTAGNKNQFFD